MRISDWSSDVCSSDLEAAIHFRHGRGDNHLVPRRQLTDDQLLDLVGNDLGLEGRFLAAEPGEQDQIVFVVDLVKNIGGIKAAPEYALYQADNLLGPLSPFVAQLLFNTTEEIGRAHV